MKEIRLFHFESCPYCRQARGWMDELIRENPDFAALKIAMIDEKLDPVTADRFDYYYVPTFYVGEEKVHEGVITREGVRDVFRRALSE